MVLKMAESLNAGDLEGSLGYFADDSVTYFVGMPPTGMEIYRGKEGIRPVWEDVSAAILRWKSRSFLSLAMWSTPDPRPGMISHVNLGGAQRVR